NVKTLVKLRRLIKSMAVSFFIIILGIAGTAFKADAIDNDGVDRPSKDSSLIDKHGFQSLFSGNSFDPSTPYVSQLNPKAVPFVQQYIRSSGKNLEKMKVWGKPYFDMYDGILSQYGLPIELKYLSVIESQLSSHVTSWAGAVGPWQIMAEEARNQGLRVGGVNDERTNFYKSTHAAAKIMKGLYKQFNDWMLVIAAYNCGAGRLRSAIRKSGSRNFWDLQAFLPLETRNHVKKFIGTHYIFEGSGGLTTMTSSEINDFKREEKSASTHQPVEQKNISTLEVSGKYNSVAISKQLGIDIGMFNKLNPNFDKLIIAGNTYRLRLPSDKMGEFAAKKHAILSESIQSLLNGSIGQSK
ncbi:MAG: Membrane-bound lytic murein transglycosylase, partial [Segetibacter sp.]|nr:Membrane-bound lytic murein transglycosylase [Segetibacter sp.]